MPNGGEVTRLIDRKIEQLATESAREKARTARWNLNVAILAYALLATIVLLSFAGVATEIVALIAILGLAMVWLMAWRREKQTYKRFYDQELRQLQELPRGEKGEAFMPSPLTRRETEILNHIARGYMNKQIAAKLGISEQTIKNHMTSILRKLDVNDRTQAVVLAMHSGWISSRVGEPSEPITSDKIKISPQKI